MWDWNIFRWNLKTELCKITWKAEITSNSPKNESKTNEPLWVMLTFFLHRDITKTFQIYFCRKKCFLLVNLFTPSFSITSGSRHLLGKKFNSLNFEHTFSYWLHNVVREVESKFCDGRCILDEQRFQSTAMLMSSTMSY